MPNAHSHPQPSSAEGMPSFPETPLRPWRDAVEYVVDGAQRSVLFWDVMRRRGNQYHEHVGKDAPHVLRFDGEILIDGRTLARPVNYGLVRITPPEGAPATGPLARPVVVVDPRAGHGPGIAGFKADSEIGMALNAGHPCCFVGFLPNPMPGRTIEDVTAAEALFLPHPDGAPQAA